MNKKVLSVLVVLVFVLGIAGLATANNGAFNDFNAHYPGKSYNCTTLCHNGNPPALNPYGAALLANGATANSVSAATFTAVEPLDSDGDGFTNGQEINANTYPGNPASHPAVTIGKITITAPAGGAIVPSGSVTTIAYDPPAGVTVASVKVKYSLDGGLTWANATGVPGVAVNTFDWNVPAPTKNKKNVILKVLGYNASSAKVAAGKSAAFTIETVSITSPTTGNVLPSGGLWTITWLTNGTSTIDHIQLQYSTNNGTTWKPIATTGAGTGDPGTFSWNPVATVAKAKSSSLIKLILYNAAGNKLGTAVSSKFKIQ